jgi:hypothetical protein
MMYVSRTRWLWPLLVLASCADDAREPREQPGDLQQQDDGSLSGDGDAAASRDADAELPDAGGAQGIAVPRITLARGGALGFCIEPGMVLEAEVTADPDTGRVDIHRSYYCDPTVCTVAPLPTRELTTEEVVELASLVEAVPEGECVGPVNPVCDPCLVQDLVIADHTYRIDPCSPELCPGFNAAAARLVTFIDRLAAAQPKVDPPDCFSPQRNLHLSLEPGALGCGCEWVGQGACIAGNALICGAQRAGDVPRWYGVIDGPCWSVCHESEAHKTLEECLSSSTLCVGPDEGDVCAKNPWPSSIPIVD